jgi:hypothetical protein
MSYIRINNLAGKTSALVAEKRIKAVNPRGRGTPKYIQALD